MGEWSEQLRNSSWQKDKSIGDNIEQSRYKVHHFSHTEYKKKNLSKQCVK